MTLCTLDSVNSWLGFTTGDDLARDAMIQEIIDSNSLAIENYCDTKLESTVITDELYEGSQFTNSLILKNIFLQSIEKIEFRYSYGYGYGVSVEDEWTTVYDSVESIDLYNMTFDSEIGVVKFDSLVPGYKGYDTLTRRPMEIINSPSVRVSYTAGFETIPADLASVCKKMSAREYKTEVGGDLLVSQEKVKNASVTYDTKTNNTNEFGATTKEMSILSHYKKVV
jgi:hypothetical protein